MPLGIVGAAVPSSIATESGSNGRRCRGSPDCVVVRGPVLGHKRFGPSRSRGRRRRSTSRLRAASACSRHTGSVRTGFGRWTGHRRGAGFGEQHVCAGEPAAVFAHLGEHGRGGNRAHAREAEEGRGIGMLSQQRVDPFADSPDVSVQHVELVDEEHGAERFPGGRARGCGHQVVADAFDQDLRAGAAAIPVSMTEAGHSARPDAAGVRRCGVVADKGQGDVPVQAGEQVQAAGW